MVYFNSSDFTLRASGALAKNCFQAVRVAIEFQAP